jgi:hypothetical protein
MEGLGTVCGLAEKVFLEHEGGKKTEARGALRFA